MRSTLTLADELLDALRARSETEGRPVEAVLDDAVRRGLAALSSPQGAADEDPGRPPWPTLPIRWGQPPLTNAYVRRLQEQFDREDAERALGFPPAEPPEGAALTEEDVRRLEERIPELAAPAFAEAYADALASGSAVLVREDEALVEVSPDGTRRVIRRLPPSVPVPRPPGDAGG